MKSLLKEKDKLFKESIFLNELSKDDGTIGFKLKQKQNEVYKKYKFFDEFLKAENKRK